jgi:hypothetical protein
MLSIYSVRRGLWGAYSRDIIFSGNSNLLKPGEVMLGLLRLCRGFNGRQHAVFLIGEQVPALLADANDASHLFTRFLVIQRQAVIPPCESVPHSRLTGQISYIINSLMCLRRNPTPTNY